MSPRAVRRAVVAVCATGVATMIAASIAENQDVSLTAGLVTAVAVLCLMVATAVGAPVRPGPAVDEEAAARVEAQVAALVADGADEAAVRALVRAAVRLGRGG